MRKDFLLIGLVSCGLCPISLLNAQNQPNVIFIMADDLGWGDVGFNGNKIIQTPNLNKLSLTDSIRDVLYLHLQEPVY